MLCEQLLLFLLLCIIVQRRRLAPRVCMPCM